MYTGRVIVLVFFMEILVSILFVELARLFRVAGEGSSSDSIALKAAFTLCSLVLQKPSKNSKRKDHILCLEKRLKLWRM